MLMVPEPALCIDKCMICVDVGRRSVLRVEYDSSDTGYHFISSCSDSLPAHNCLAKHCGRLVSIYVNVVASSAY